MKMKVIIIVVLLVLALVVIAGALLWYFMQQPLYQPGLVRAEKNLRASLAPPAQPDDDHFWQVEPDIQLYHFAAGEGRNVLIIHGGPGYPYRQLWLGLEPLTNKFKFHFYDQRGCGRSTRPIDRFSSGNYYQNVQTLDQTLGLGAQIADIERIRQILGDEKLILIGHSWGGFLAALYAAEFPEHVEAMILVAPADVLVMSAEQGGGLFEEIRQRLPENKQAEFDAYLADYLDYGNIFTKSEADLVALNEVFAEYYGAAAETPLPAEGESGGWMVHAMYFSMGLRHDYRDALRRVSAPVLVIHGKNDLQPETVSRLYAEVFPNASFQVMDDSTHFPFEEQPEAFAAAVDKFLNQ
ncbi:MAG: alpha/beta hydrolase [Anaerolineae bacterium]|nr:alpha/beta hydrolase [Anaerolineae bacterium]